MVSGISESGEPCAGLGGPPSSAASARKVSAGEGWNWPLHREFPGRSTPASGNSGTIPA